MAPCITSGRFAALHVRGCGWLARVLAAARPRARLRLRPADALLSVAGTLNRMPSLASSGARVAVAWTSTGDDVMDAYVAISEDGGVDVSRAGPRQRHDRATSRRTRSSRRASPSAARRSRVIWPSRREGPAAIRMARSTDGGRTFTPSANLHAASAHRTSGLAGAGARTERRLSCGLARRTSRSAVDRPHQHHASRGAAPHASRQRPEAGCVCSRHPARTERSSNHTWRATSASAARPRSGSGRAGA